MSDAKSQTVGESRSIRGGELHPLLGFFSPAVVTLIGLLLTLLGAFAVFRAEQSKIEARFNARVDSVHRAVSQRMDAYIQVLRGGIGLFEASDSVTREEWLAYYGGLDINERFPGIQGFAYAEIFPAGEAAAVEERARGEGHPDFEVWPESENELRSSILFIEPFDSRNKRAFGYDMYSNEIRNVAMTRAIETGEPAMSGKVILVQETDQDVQAGFLTLLPLYEKEVPLSTVKERRAAIIGFVYAAFRMDDFIAGVLDKRTSEGISMVIYDGESTTTDALMYRGEGKADDPIFEDASLIELAGRKWTISLASLPKFGGSGNHETSPIVLISGILVSLLAAAFVRSMRTTQTRALALAERMTVDLKSSEQRVRHLVSTLEERVEERTRKLKAANDELEAFSYSISHDLRAPLRSIHGFATALKEDYGDGFDEDATMFVDKVTTGAERMGNLIDDLLKLSRVSQAELTRVDVDVSSLAENVITTLRDNDPERKVECVVAKGLKADGDTSMVDALLQNLIENAWKFTRTTEPANIEIGTELRDGAPVFFVRDNGVGFDTKYASKVFQPFQRLHTSDEFEGAGIGLSTVRRIVQRHGGWVEIESRTSAGTTVYFSLG